MTDELVEKAVMVCPQCEGEGSYADGLDEAACSADCTRCGGNGWIVDLAALRETHHLAPRHTEGLTQILPMDTAPQNGVHILAKTLPRQKDDPFYSYGGRWFVTHYVGLGDWSLFPGFGVSADWFEGWARLPLAAAAEQAKQEHNLSELTGLLVDAENALSAMIRGHEDGEDLAQTVAADIRQRLGDGRDQ